MEVPLPITCVSLIIFSQTDQYYCYVAHYPSRLHHTWMPKQIGRRIDPMQLRFPGPVSGFLTSLTAGSNLVTIAIYGIFLPLCTEPTSAAHHEILYRGVEGHILASRVIERLCRRKSSAYWNGDCRRDIHASPDKMR